MALVIEMEKSSHKTQHGQTPERGRFTASLSSLFLWSACGRPVVGLWSKMDRSKGKDAPGCAHPLIETHHIAVVLASSVCCCSVERARTCV